MSDHEQEFYTMLMTDEDRLDQHLTEMQALDRVALTEADREAVIDAAIRAAVNHEFHQPDRTALWERVAEHGIEAALAVRVKLEACEGKIVDVFLSARREATANAIETARTIIETDAREKTGRRRKGHPRKPAHPTAPMSVG